MATSYLSVVIAHKNREQLLRRSLRRWREQCGFSKGEIELIVVDDGSDEPPTAACLENDAVLVQTPPSESRKGPSVAWTAGLKVAMGRVLACTHPEIVPDRNVARYLYGVCSGDWTYLNPGLCLWIRDGALERRVHEIHDLDRLQEYAIRANVVVYRLDDGEGEVFDGEGTVGDCARMLGANREFWKRKTEFGGHSNDEIRYVLRGYFWNNLFAMRREVWRWMNYFRLSDSWGIDDTDFQERNAFLRIVYAYTDDVFGYHQCHGPQYRGGVEDLVVYSDEASARLLWRVPPAVAVATPDINLKRGDFWR